MTRVRRDRPDRVRALETDLKALCDAQPAALSAGLWQVVHDLAAYAHHGDPGAFHAVEAMLARALDAAEGGRA